MKNNRAQSLIEYVVLGGIVALAVLPLISPYAKHIGQRITDSAPAKSSTVNGLDFSSANNVVEKGLQSAPSNNNPTTPAEINPQSVNTPIVVAPPPPPPPTPQDIRGCNGENIYDYETQLENLKNEMGDIASIDSYNAANWDPINNPVHKKTQEAFDLLGISQGYGSPLFYNPADASEKATRDELSSNKGWLPSIVYFEHEKIFDASPPVIDTSLFYSKQTVKEAQLFLLSVMKKDKQRNSSGALQYNPQLDNPVFDFATFNGYLEGYWSAYYNGSVAGKNIYQIREEFCLKDPNTQKYDPMTVTINGEQYMFVQDKNGDGKFGGPSELLGFSDTKESLFQEMKSLDSNGDGYVSSEELANANIKLLKVENGVLTNQEYLLNNIQGIKLSSFETSNDNNDGIGEFGTFEVELKDGIAEGKETFDLWSVLVKLFTVIKDFVFDFF